MRRDYWANSRLIGLIFGLCWAQNSLSSSIQGPDGKRAPIAAPKPQQPSLEEQLRKRKKQQAEPPSSVQRPIPNEPAMSTEELLGPMGKEAMDAGDGQGIFPEADPWFRLSLGLAPASASPAAGPIKTWRFEPGIVLENAYRLSDPKKASSFWLGMRLASWNGTGASETSFSRFSVVYIGPLFAFEWTSIADANTPRSRFRQNLSFGIAGVSRQADRDFPGQNKSTMTQAFGLDGSGLWLAYGLRYQWIEGYELSSQVGLQNGAAYNLSYLSLGVNLWTD